MDNSATTWGLAINKRLCNSNELSMRVVLDSVTKKIGAAFGSSDFPVGRVVEAFWKHSNFIRVAGREYPFPVCEGVDMQGNEVPVKYDVRITIEEVTSHAVAKMMNCVGNGYDIDRIILKSNSSYVCVHFPVNDTTLN